MNFVKIRYVGKAAYKDRTPLKNLWQPGEDKLVSERDAKTLLAYLEFERVKATAATKKAAEAGDTALELAQKAQAQRIAAEKLAKKQTEDTLMEITSMNKGALADYAKQNYGVELDVKAKVDDLRNQVTALVQGGKF